MDIIKNNQLLKVELQYDQDTDWAFKNFVACEELEVFPSNRRSYDWFKIGNPDARHYRESQLNEEMVIRKELEVLRHNISHDTMPALTVLEAWDLSEQVNAEDWEAVDYETARHGLLSMTHQKWYDAISDFDYAEEELRPYRYTATGYCQGDFAYLYLIGIDEAEASAIVREFEQYAYDTPYQFHVELIDCQSGETLDSDALCGIYDDTSDLKHTKEELECAIKNLNGIDEEVLRLALEALQDVDYTSVKW